MQSGLAGIGKAAVAWAQTSGSTGQSTLRTARRKPFSETDFERVQSGPAAREQQADYFKPSAGEEPAVEVPGCQPSDELLTAAELTGLSAALLHPAARTKQEELLSQVLLATSQRPKDRAVKAAETREQKVARWQAALGGQTIAARLQSLVPVKGKKGKAQKKENCSGEVKKSLLKTAKRPGQGTRRTKKKGLARTAKAAEDKGCCGRQPPSRRSDSPVCCSPGYQTVAKHGSGGAAGFAFRQT